MSIVATDDKIIFTNLTTKRFNWLPWFLKWNRKVVSIDRGNISNEQIQKTENFIQELGERTAQAIRALKSEDQS